jgi:hypothetical protein
MKFLDRNILGIVDVLGIAPYLQGQDAKEEGHGSWS